MGTRSTPPGPRGLELIRARINLKRGATETYRTLFRRFGDVFRLGGLRPILFLSRPDHVKHVLKDNCANYAKSVSFRDLQALLGTGLITAQGTKWRSQRRVLAPLFRSDKIKTLTPMMVREINKLVERWENDRTGVRDIWRDFRNLSISIISHFLFGAEHADRADELGDRSATASDFVVRRFYSSVRFPLFAPLPSHARCGLAVSRINKIFKELTELARRNAASPTALCETLRHARDPHTGEGLGKRAIADELMTLFMAGHETTSCLLTWSFYLLARHPQVLVGLREEVANVCGGHAIAPDHLEDLVLIDRVLAEAMRLYPPVPLISRTAVGEDELAGFHVRPGMIVCCCSYLTHRHADFWENPDRFDPGRFSSERIESRPEFAYYPFGGGPRRCLGDAFAIQESKLVLAKIMQSGLEFELCHDQPPVEPVAMITLRPRAGLMLRFRRAAH